MIADCIVLENDNGEIENDIMLDTFDEDKSDMINLIEIEEEEEEQKKLKRRRLSKRHEEKKTKTKTPALIVLDDD